MLPKMTVKTTVVARGCRTNQIGPRMLCLYIAVKSRSTRNQSRSLYSIISFQSMLNQEVLGRTWVRIISQHPPVWPFQNHVGTFGKFLCRHHQETDLAFYLHLDIVSQPIYLIHIHIPDYEYVDKTAVPSDGVIVEGIDRIHLSQIVQDLIENLVDPEMLLHDGMDLGEDGMFGVCLIEDGISPLLLFQIPCAAQIIELLFQGI